MVLVSIFTGAMSLKPRFWVLIIQSLILLIIIIFIMPFLPRISKFCLCFSFLFYSILFYFILFFSFLIISNFFLIFHYLLLLGLFALVSSSRFGIKSSRLSTTASVLVMNVVQREPSRNGIRHSSQITLFFSLLTGGWPLPLLLKIRKNNLFFLLSFCFIFFDL